MNEDQLRQEIEKVVYDWFWNHDKLTVRDKKLTPTGKALAKELTDLAVRFARSELEKERLDLIDVARRNQNRFGYLSAYSSLMDVLGMRLSEKGKRISAQRDIEEAGKNWTRLTDGSLATLGEPEKTCTCPDDAGGSGAWFEHDPTDDNCPVHGDRPL